MRLTIGSVLNRLICVALSIGLLATNFPAVAATEDQVKLATVTVTATAIRANSSNAGFLSLNSFPSFSYGYMNWDAYMEYQLLLSESLKSPTGIPDVRCNLGASQATREITSRSAHTDRWLAATQLYSFINAQHPEQRPAAGNIRNSLSMFFNGGKRPTFTITYADGGREAWLIVPNSSVSLDQSGTSQMISQGDGQQKPCPQGARG